MLRRNFRPRPTEPKPSNDPRHDLARLLLQDGPINCACGTCGGTVRADDPEAVRTTVQVGRWPHQATSPSWAFHRECCDSRPAVLVARALSPDERPLRVGQEHYDVAQRIGAPLRYCERPGTKSTDRGRSRWVHTGKRDLEELRAAVEQRRRELTEPVPHESGLGCQVCGRSHDLLDRWALHRDRPACGSCTEMIRRSQIPGNRELWQYARDAVLAEARHLLPARAITWPLPLARDLPSYNRHDFKVAAETPERAPWSYVADLPEAPLSDEERQEARLAELERRLAGATV